MKFTMRLTGLVLAAFVFALASAVADDFTVSEGELSDQDFYRAIACGAEAGGWCKSEIIKWPPEQRHTLKIFIEEPQDNFPQEHIKVVTASVKLAITEINISGADIELELTDEASAPIHVYMVDAAAGETVSGTGNAMLDGGKIQGGRATMRWLRDGSIGKIIEAAVAISSSLSKSAIRSVVLEEILQSLGLPWDIRNPNYNGKSIFAEDSNNIYNIRRHDTFALRLHYPTGCERASDCL